MRHRKVKRRTKKQPAAQNTFKLKELRVTLYDIASYPVLIPSPYKRSFNQQLNRLKNTSCTPKNHNTQLSKQNVQKTNVQSSRCNRSVKKSPLESISLKKSREKCETIKSKLDNTDIKSIKETVNYNECDKVLRSRSKRYKWQLIIDDESSTMSDCSSDKIR